MAKATDLQGTDKQVAWATDIRTGKLLDADAAIAIIRRTPPANNEGLSDQAARRRETQIPRAELGYAALYAETSASWWIDHRNDNAGQLIWAKAPRTL